VNRDKPTSEPMVQAIEHLERRQVELCAHSLPFEPALLDEIRELIAKARLKSAIPNIASSACTAAEGAFERIEAVLSGERDMSPCAVAANVYDSEAARPSGTCSRWLASLDSMVVGSRRSSVSSRRAIRSRPPRDVKIRPAPVFSQAFSVAKRVRRETAIATKAVSVASAAVELACSIFEDLEGRTAMIMGAGEMSVLTARHLMGHGLSSFS